MVHTHLGRVHGTSLHTGDGHAHAEADQDGFTTNADRRAAVACILRRARSSGGGSGGTMRMRQTPLQQPDSAHAHGAHDLANSTDLEILFILRASRGGRWSGQVAFPGGHAEGTETDLEAAIREVQ